jgi:hypothetical protein
MMGAALNAVGQVAEEHGDEVALEAAFGFVTGGSSTGLRLISAIGKHAGLTRYARRLSGTVQRSIDHLTGELAKGNLNPGIGTKHLFGGDLRSASARRSEGVLPQRGRRRPRDCREI